MSNSYFWVIILLLGLITFCIRASFIFLHQHLNISKETRKSFELIPLVVFPALIGPAIFLHRGEVTMLVGKERILASLIALYVAYISKNVFFTLLTGLFSLFLMKILLP